MAEFRTVTTLRSKRAEIEASIAAYERKLAQARADLAHITAAITIFEASGDPAEMPQYADLHRLFTRGEVTAICKAALASEGPLNTRELAARVMRAKGLDEGDQVLRTSLTLRIVHALDKQVNAERWVTRGSAGVCGCGASGMVDGALITETLSRPSPTCGLTSRYSIFNKFLHPRANKALLISI